MTNDRELGRTRSRSIPRNRPNLRPFRVVGVALAAALTMQACSGGGGHADDAYQDSTTSVGRSSTVRGSEPPRSSATTGGGEDEAGDPRPTAGCGKEPGHLPENRILESSIESVGGDRVYLVYVPSNYDPQDPTPVVFTFHGAGSNKEQQIVYSGFTPLAEEHSFLVVAPDALGSPRAWSPFGVLGKVRDLDFFGDLLARVEETFCVDTTRVYATGMSSGGFMSSAVACRYSQFVAAIAPVTATYWREPECGEALPTPYVYFHGTDDPVVPYWGPSGTAPPEGGEPHGSAPYNASLWARHNGCEGSKDKRISDEVVVREWTGCEAETSFYTVEGGGHTWPGGVDVSRFGIDLGRTTKDISATEIIWDLFSRSTRPGAGVKT